MEESNESTNNISMKYYNFYTKIYLVTVVIFNIIILGININNVQIWTVPAIITVIGNIVLGVIIPIKLKDELHLKTKLGYVLVITFLILDYIYRISISALTVYSNNPNINIEMYMTIYLFLYSIWYVPNLIYFTKRKSMFTNKK